MIVFPNCKINLGLHIVGKRDDGFHNLETVFYPLPFKDALEIIPNPHTEENEFTATGLPVEGNPENNLCLKAWHLLKKDFPKLPSVKIHLHKAIPMGAGLGGGSADAAFMLKLLNDKFDLDIFEERLIRLALELGSDCSFFIINKPCIATGRGEVLEEVAVDLSAYKIILINPGIHINTGWAFSQLAAGLSDGSRPSDSLKNITLKEIISQPVETWKDKLYNDFEKPVFEVHPEIEAIKEELYRQGAVYAAMSGSGSTVFGIFPQNFVSNDETALKELKKENYFIKMIN